MDKIIFSNKYEKFSFIEFYDFNELTKKFANDDFLFADFSEVPNHAYKKYPLWKQKSQGETFCTENHFNESENKINFATKKVRITIKLSENEKNISFKIFYYTNTREKGQKFFRKTTHCQFITFNKQKKLFYRGSVQGYHKKRKCIKTVRVLGIYNGVFNSLASTLENQFYTHDKDSFQTENGLLSRNNFIIFLVEKFFWSIFPEQSYVPFSRYDKFLFEYMYGIRNIKLPNNWESFTQGFIPKLSFFRKNQNKFIDTIMKSYNLEGKKIRKVLHMVENFYSTQTFEWASNFFGKNFLMSQEDIVLKKILDFGYFNSYHYPLKFSKKEMHNIYQIFLLVLDKKITTTTFSDHFSMLHRLENLEKTNWNSNNYHTFTDEHLELTEKVSFYTQGTLTRKFDSEFIQKFEEPFHVDGNLFFPVILKDTNHYNQESFVQSNCVKTYVNRPYCIICSLRKNSKDSLERVSVELQLKKVNEYIILIRTQTLMKFNNPLTPEYLKVFKHFDENLKKVQLQTNFSLPEVELELGNKFFETKIVFDEKNSYFTFENVSFSHILNYGIPNGIPVLEQYQEINLQEII